MQDFQVLFNEKTEELVRWLFETLAPRIKLEAAKIEKLSKFQHSAADGHSGALAAGSGAESGLQLQNAMEGASSQPGRA